MQSTLKRLKRGTFWAALALSFLVLIVNAQLRGGIMKLQAEPTTSINAPEFPSGAKWLNTDKPLSLRALRGKIVLLDFWTYGCINCMHVLPDLKKLERKYPNELVVIGVHSAKFQNEQDSSNIRNAMLRYNIEHPVLVDSQMSVWNAFTVRAWPTFVLIDPAGKIVGSVAGEGNYEVVDQTIAATIKKFKASGQLNATPLKFALDAAKVPSTPLWYPGKVVADAQSGRVFIADSNHNRIIIARLNGEVEAVAGSGEAGAQDGAFDAATFRNPQGMALKRDGNGALTLFVADTNNHLIRALDLNRGTVSTLAGTGQQAEWRATGGMGTQAALASPWDLWLAQSTLYVAMAGPHQIWAMDLDSQKVAPFAGSGREARIDGNLKDAAFAQPSGLASDGQRLFVADSEISAIRQIDLSGETPQVKTLAGGDLFDFGDRDGLGDAVRLQHPLGVAWRDGVLYFVDTYNNKIKTLDPQNGRVQSFLGGARGDSDGTKPLFYEPGGISVAGNKLFVADTNNHKIKVVDLATKNVATLALKNLPAALPAEPQRPLRAVDAEAGTIVLPLVVLAPNARGEIILDAQLPAHHKLNKESSPRAQARIEGQGVTLGKSSVGARDFKLPLRLEMTTGQAGARGELVLSSSIYYCTDEQGLCKFKALRFRAPFEVREGGAKIITLRAAL